MTAIAKLTDGISAALIVDERSPLRTLGRL
jgi:hypothetical protein